MATYVNDLRLKEISTGDEAGTWGTSTNTNLELIGEALGYATQQVFSSDADATTTVADGASDPARAMYFKVTSAGSLTATRTCTIAPNTVSRVMFIENATTGSQSIAISQGSGANVTIATGKTAVVYLDGAGSGAAVVDAMAGVDPGVTDTLAEVLVAGNTSGGTGLTMSSGDDLTLTGANYNVVWDSSADSLTFADNSKAIFGAGSDLKIYHDGSNSYIDDAGTGGLIVRADNFYLRKANDVENMIIGSADGAVTLYHDNSAKLATTATGIDVTGTVTADGLTVSAPSGDTPVSIVTTTAGSFLQFTDVNTTAGRSPLVGAITDGLAFYTSAGSYSQKMTVTAGGNVGIGTGSPASPTGFGSSGILHLKGGTGNDCSVVLEGLSGSGGRQEIGASGGALQFYRGAATGSMSESMRIDSSGRVGIGTSSPSSTLHLKDTRATLRLESESIGGTTFDIRNGVSGGSEGGISFGDITNSATRMVIDSSGNVGIGASSPVTLKSATTLQVSGNAKLGDDNGRGLLSLGDILSTGANVGIWRGAAGAYAGTGNYLNLGGYDGITFTTGAADIASQTERMRIDASGNVGIGTSNATPSNGEGLCLGAASTITRLDMRNSTTGDATGDGTSLQLNGNNFTIENREAGYVAIATSLTERMRIDASGNVGIGCTPGYTFEVRTNDTSATPQQVIRQIGTGDAAIGFQIPSAANWYAG
ncbi:hypothetical protein, partial [Planktomarina sp.]|uniref:hypothetical protein n=1 Tax=Planktomarina sp. TaxID=2024851 RepID=UPI0032609A8E